MRLVLLLPLAGCVTTGVVAGNLDATARGLSSVDADVARACAPRDLALATSHLDFARLEGRQGRPARVAHHLTEADAALARLQAALAACAPAAPPPPAPPACEVPPGATGPFDADGCPVAGPDGPDADADADGVPDRRDFCKDNPEDPDGWEDEDGCPDPDDDLDGVPDVDDACPREPGSADAAGCPVLDRDKDGVLDASDRCPEAPEVVNDYLDQDGCPDAAPAALRVRDGAVELLVPPTFDASGGLSGGFEALADLARLLRDAPGVRLELDIHTDATLPPDQALALTQAQARALTLHLEGLGAPPERVRGVGYGSERPIDTNRTEPGRARNRRVEVRILDAGAR